MFWVLCVSCFVRQYQVPQRKFYISSCTHIFCERCINYSHPFCQRCGVNIEVIACDSKMPPFVQNIFCNASEKASMLIKAMEYQAGQRSGLMSHLMSTEQRYNTFKSQKKEVEIKYVNMKQKLERSLKRITELEIANETLKKQIMKLRQTALPASSPHPPSDWFSNFPQSIHSRQSVKDTSSAPFTPKNCYEQFRHRTPAITPSFTSSKTPSTPDSSSYRYACNRSVPGFTPPQKTMELLNILNKKNELNWRNWLKN